MTRAMRGAVKTSPSLKIHWHECLPVFLYVAPGPREGGLVQKSAKRAGGLVQKSLISLFLNKTPGSGYPGQR